MRHLLCSPFFPSKALQLNLYLLLLSIAVGLVYYLIFKNKSPLKSEEKEIPVHKEEPDCTCFEPQQIIPQLQENFFYTSFADYRKFIIPAPFIYNGRISSSKRLGEAYLYHCITYRAFHCYHCA